MSDVLYIGFTLLVVGGVSWLAARRPSMTNPTERLEERDSLALIEALRLETEHCEAARAEVKELREERDNAINAEKVALRYAGERIKQMEEALREADKALAGMWSFSEESRSKMAAESPHIYYIKASEIIRATLSSLDSRGEDSN